MTEAADSEIKQLKDENIKLINRDNLLSCKIEELNIEIKNKDVLISTLESKLLISKEYHEHEVNLRLTFEAKLNQFMSM